MKSKPIIDSRLLSVKDAAAYLGISHWKLRSLIADEKIIHVQIGRRILIDRQDLDEMIEEAKMRR